MMLVTPPATLLLLLGVPERAVRDIMGWSNSSMVKRYYGEPALEEAGFDG